MSDTGFEFTGLEELQEDIAKCVAQYPEETSKKIYNLAGQFTKDVNKKFPASYDRGKRPFSKNWKRERDKTQFTGYTVRVNVMNKSPHFHLVENGHVKKIPVSSYAAYIQNRTQSSKAETRQKKPRKIKGATFKIENRGFVPGKHYCERTRNEWHEKYPQLVEEYVDKMLKEHKL